MRNKKMQISKLSDDISPAYKKFFDKFKEIDNLDLKNWQTVHILSYICKKYEEYYGLKYTFKYNDIPSKCTEVFRVKQLSQMLSSDPTILKEYIDWVFKNKIIEKKKIITSLGYFTTTDIVNEYKFKFLFNKVEITRASKLPENIIKIAKDINMNISTYGDLAFLVKSSESVVVEVKKQLNNIGFDYSILERLK
jgi:hypothetical protein